MRGSFLKIIDKQLTSLGRFLVFKGAYQLEAMSFPKILTRPKPSRPLTWSI